MKLKLDIKSRDLYIWKNGKKYVIWYSNRYKSFAIHHYTFHSTRYMTFVELLKFLIKAK